MRFVTVFIVSLVTLFSAGKANLLMGAWDENVPYTGGTIDYLLAIPDTGEVRIIGGGLPEWRQKYKAGGFNNGVNGIPENGGGDDVFMGRLDWQSGVQWTTSVPESVGRIHPTKGVFESGGSTGEGSVTASYAGATPVSEVIRVYPPDWQPGNSKPEGDGGNKNQMSQTTPMAAAAPQTRSSLQISNYPNPFNPSTTFSYRLTEEGARQVSLEVFSLRGRRVTTLVDEVQVPGDYQIQWNGVNDHGEKVSSGIYLYKLSVDTDMVVRKMTILK